MAPALYDLALVPKHISHSTKAASPPPPLRILCHVLNWHGLDKSKEAGGKGIHFPSPPKSPRSVGGCEKARGRFMNRSKKSSIAGIGMGSGLVEVPLFFFSDLQSWVCSHTSVVLD